MSQHEFSILIRGLKKSYQNLPRTRLRVVFAWCLGFILVAYYAAMSKRSGSKS